mmetsp:Transcript_7289/g.5567  ORF Transcript_7289/g.5567 Transcript_7289/m.5567 type:complete len:179 (-) Transcript_7289:123-659(-)
MHRLKENAMHPDFSTEELQTYIKMARSLKPRFTAESAQVLKEEYKRLRQNEKNSQKNSAYKVTVRQLESLIRLSEAMARVHCSSVIIPSYVKEVARLVSSSNINIVRSDMFMEDEEFQADINENQMRRRQEEHEFQADLAQQQQNIQNLDLEPKKTKITYDEYQRFAYLIVETIQMLQ